tara:strand:- start:4732 stop:5880 length:1149 start_codon:yes stop_codon:yes gene_type:complete
MKIYETLARGNFPKTYTGKILLVSFIGVHVPMFGAVAYVLLADTKPFLEQLDVLGAMLLATLIGTGGTMFVMKELLAPVRAASEAADLYLRNRQIPRLPTKYTDAAGVLMSSVQECVTRLDASLSLTEGRYHQLERDHSEQFRTLSGMKHDFRTPLTQILGFASLMKAEAIGPIGNTTYQSFVQKIGASGQQLLETLNSVIDLSDSQSLSQIGQDSEHLDLVALARDAVNIEHMHAEMRNVEVEVRAPAELELFTVKSVAKNLTEAMLHAAISITPTHGAVSLAIEATETGACLLVESCGGQLSLEDVPPKLARDLDGLKSGAGTLSATPDSSTPMTLRLSLIDTLCRSVGAQIRLTQTEGVSFSMHVELDAATSEMLSLAA